MQSGTLFYRVIARKLQGAERATQFILLGGFVPELTTAKAAYYETLSPSYVLQQSEIDNKVASMAKHGNAADTRDTTKEDVAKKLSKLWEVSATVPAGLQQFGEMRIGQYL
jgi:hypothetical protein